MCIFVRGSSKSPFEKIFPFLKPFNVCGCKGLILTHSDMLEGAGGWSSWEDLWAQV